MLKRLTLGFIILFLCFSVSYAGELAAQEAANYYQQGLKAQKEANIPAAVIAYQKTLLLDPYNAQWKKFITNNYGVLYFEQGDLAKAEQAFTEALAMDPDYRPAQLNLGFVYDKQPDRLKAIEYWLKILNIKLEDLKPQNLILGEADIPKKK